MPVETTYTALRENLSSYLGRVSDNREVVFVRRRGASDVALVAAEELESLLETAHLLRSPKNAHRLLNALEKAQRGTGKPQTIERLRAGLPLDAKRRSK